MSEVWESCSDPLLWYWDAGKMYNLCVMMIHNSVHRQPCKVKVLHISVIPPCLHSPGVFFPLSEQKHCLGLPVREVRKVFGLWHPPVCGLPWRGVWCTRWQIFSTAHTDYIDPVTQWSLFSFKNRHQLPSICIISLLTTKKASGKVLQQSLDNGREA